MHASTAAAKMDSMLVVAVAMLLLCQTCYATEFGDCSYCPDSCYSSSACETDTTTRTDCPARCCFFDVLTLMNSSETAIGAFCQHHASYYHDYARNVDIGIALSSGATFYNYYNDGLYTLHILTGHGLLPNEIYYFNIHVNYTSDEGISYNTTCSCESFKTGEG